jgi:glycosyltransferase involved in cell wall biosynthesis
MDKISIIMPVRNALPYLTNCLDSILQQSYQNWELLAVDDRSQDHSLSVLRDYASRDYRIQCFQNEGSGIIDALNTGYGHSCGQLITRMDADDLMPSIKLERLLELVKAAGQGYLSTGKVKYISDTFLGDGYKKYENWLNGLCDENGHYKEIYRECVIPSPCWMMHREDFEKIGGFNSAAYPEDYDLCFRMYENQIRVVSAVEVLHIWRDHGARASRNDDHYSDNRFLDLKVKYFLRNEYQPNEKVILWGAGAKGKKIAQLLVKNKVNFEWITNNKKKIGKHIYTQMIQDTSILKLLGGQLSIILAVANKEEQSHILQSISLMANSHNLYKFC